MTVSEMITLMQDLSVLDLDNMASSGSPTNANYVAQLNWAQRLIGFAVRDYDPKVTLTLVADQYSYSLMTATAKRVIRPYRVWINNVCLKNELREPGLYSLAALERRDLNWITRSSSTPYAAVWTGGDNLIIHPKPTSAVVTAGNNFVAGEVLHADMSASSLGVECPSSPQLHEAIAALAVVIAALPTSSEQIQWQRLNEFKGGVYAEMVRAYARTNAQRRAPINQARSTRRFLP